MTKTNYTKAGELHFREAAGTGDKYLSGVLTITINDQPISIALTIFSNKRKFQPQAPDAFVYVEQDEFELLDPNNVDDIPF